MSKKYVPGNVFLKCDKGLIPCRLQLVRPRARLYGEEQWATENDALPLVNIGTFGACAATQKPCVPLTQHWEDTQPGSPKIMVLGSAESPLLDTSRLPCSAGGQISIFFTRAAVQQALHDDRQADQAHAVAAEAKDNSLLLFGAAVLVGVAVVGLTIATGGAALPLLAVAGEAALAGAAVGAGVGAVAGGVEGYADGGWQGAAKGAGLGLLAGAAMGAVGGAASAVGGPAAAALLLGSGAMLGVGAVADGYAFYKQPTQRNGLVLVGDVVVLAGGIAGDRLARLAGMKQELVNTSKQRADELVAERERIKAANEGKKPKKQEPQTVSSPVTASIADPQVLNPATGKPAVYQGENFNMKTVQGRADFAKFKQEAHPELQARIKSQEDLLASGWKPENPLSGTPGAHAEVVAYDKALKARELAGMKVDSKTIEEIYLHNRSLLPSQYPNGAPDMCSHCRRILSGINPIGHK